MFNFCHSFSFKNTNINIEINESMSASHGMCSNIECDTIPIKTLHNLNTYFKSDKPKKKKKVHAFYCTVHVYPHVGLVEA